MDLVSVCKLFGKVQNPLFQVKLSGRTNDIQVTWAGCGLLAVSTGDNSVRLWNLDSGDNYVLSLHGPSYRDQEYVMCLSYSANKRESPMVI